jgi:hypothetical protein
MGCYITRCVGCSAFCSNVGREGGRTNERRKKEGSEDGRRKYKELKIRQK